MKAGIFPAIKMSEYLSLKALSSGRCNTILTQSPFHALHDEGGDPSEVSDIGTAIHDGLLEGVDRIVAIEADDWRTKAAKAARDEARAAGKIPMLARKVEQVTHAIESAKAYMLSSEIAEEWSGASESELTIIWKEGKLFCKARPDWLSADRSLLIHVKTTAGSAQPESWIRNQLTACGYDLAVAFYERGLYAAEDGAGQNAPTSVFLIIEQNAPYGCSLVGLSPAMLDLASRKAERAIRIWQECQETGHFPCYPSRIAYAEPMPWQLANEETEQILGQMGKQADRLTDDELQGGIPA